MSKKKSAQPDISSDEVIEPEILEPGEYIPNTEQAKKYYKSAADYQAKNSFGSLFTELMELLTDEDLAEIEAKVGDRRSNRRHRLKETILEHEDQAGNIQEAEMNLTAIKAHLISLDPELESVFGTYDRKAESAYRQGKKAVRDGFNLAELNNRSSQNFDSEPDDYWAEDSSGANLYGIEF